MKWVIVITTVLVAKHLYESIIAVNFCRNSKKKKRKSVEGVYVTYPQFLWTSRDLDGKMDFPPLIIKIIQTRTKNNDV